MLRICGLIICLFMLCSCQATKIDATLKQKQLQKEFAKTMAFKITSNWANPMVTTSMNALNNSGLIAPGSTANRFYISQGSNHLTIDGSKVDVDLPYFGERRMGGGYNDDNGIIYKGDIENLSVEFDEKKSLYRITFSMKNKTESFDVSIDLFQNLNTRININSTHRTSISYDGYAEVLAEETEED